MSTVTYTKSQRRAIDTRGSDVLVSAGAGSGKTTVLAERIISRIREGCDIRDFLVVTFTNSAAADLKQKLYKRFTSLCAEEPDNPRYRRQLYTLNGADICTIDAFCLQHVKQAASALGYGGASVGDEAFCATLVRDSASAALDELCDGDHPAADLLLDNFANHKSDDGLLDTAVKLYSKLRSYPFYEDWLSDTVKAYASEAEAFYTTEFFELPHGKAVKRELQTVIGSAMRNARALYDLATNDAEAAFADKVFTAIEPLETAVEQGYLAFWGAMSAFPKLKRPNNSPEDYAAVYKAATDGVKILKGYLRTKDQLIKEYQRTARVLAALETFMLRMDSLYTAEKKRRGIMDFADAEQIFLGMLVEKTSGGFLKTTLCRQLSAAYTEVYVDEYQDVSPLQDTIFKVLGQNKRFMVGDAKQSIYGFRNAYPELFVSYRDGFGDGDCPRGERIFLKENFRCDKGIIDFCNYLFNRIYTKESAGSDYKTEALEFGKGGEGNFPVQVCVLENAEERDEMSYVADEIARLVSKGTAPSDIAVLMRKTALIADYGKALTKRGVPVVISAGKEDLLSKPEVLLAVSLLRVIDNPTDDISLAAVLRSPIYRFTAEELTEIRHGGISLYDDLRRAARGKRSTHLRYRLRIARIKVTKRQKNPVVAWGAEDALSEKCAAFLEKLELYRTKALFLPVHKLLWFVYDDTGIFGIAPSGGEKTHRQNLFSLYSLAMGMESNSYKGVSVFTDYLWQLQRQDSSPKAEPNNSGDGVRIMTVHGSKGLEFPVVFVSGYGSKMLKADRKSPLIADYHSGISIKLKEQAEAINQSTLLRDVELMAEDRRCVAEELRVLYVALTRARERLYLTASLKKTLADVKEGKITNYSDLFITTVAKGKEMFYNMEVVDIATAEATPAVAVDMAEREEEIPEVPGFGAPLPPPAVQTAKYSASVLKRGADGLFTVEAEALVTDREPSFVGEERVTGAMRGTANHLFMQFASFDNAEKDVAAEADRLLVAGFVTNEQRALMDTDAIAHFFNTPLYREIKASSRVYREKRFSTRVPSYLFSGGSEEDVMLQGVIDCFFENPDGTYSLVDYKTDYIRPGEEQVLVDRHGAQLYLYRLYIEKLTGRPVSRSYIYSFALGKAINCGNTAKI